MNHLSVFTTVKVIFKAPMKSFLMLLNLIPTKYTELQNSRQDVPAVPRRARENTWACKGSRQIHLGTFLVGYCTGVFSKTTLNGTKIPLKGIWYDDLDVILKTWFSK